MWTRIAHIVLKFRLQLIIVLALITGVLAYYGSQVKMSFHFAELVPKTDTSMQKFMKFKETFGQDANVLLLGVEDPKLYRLKNFRKYQELMTCIGQIRFDSTQKKVVTKGDSSQTEVFVSILDINKFQYLTPNKRKRRFDIAYPFDTDITTQAQLDSLLKVLRNQEFYKDYLYTEEGNALVAMINFKKIFNDSQYRQFIAQDIIDKTDAFTEETGIQVYLAGVPFVRSIMTLQVASELKMFLLLSLLVTAVILYFFFRSFYAVIFPLVVIGVAVVWTMATIVLCGYEISMLTGLIPPIIVVIGVPNCIYLLNKYHQSYRKTGNKIKALSEVIRKIGVVTLITNCTTAIGFAVLISADITLLREFGVVAGINVMATFFISVVLIPAVFSFLPEPNPKQLRHLDFKFLTRFLLWLDYTVANRRKHIYWITAALVLITSYGCWKVYAVSFMVDDIPAEHRVKKDLTFFEESFKGVMPLEIVIDTKEKNPYTNLDVLRKLDQAQEYLGSLPEVSKPFSILNVIKGLRQSYWGNNPDFYGVPTAQDKNRILSLVRKTKGNQGDILKSFADTTGKLRISLKVKDLGSKKTEALINEKIKPELNKIFVDGDVQMNYDITGTTLLFIRGINFLIRNLQESLVIAIVLIAFIMGLLFRNLKMILISLLPNLIPLLITGALMGYFGIPLKPSTALIFSIAFGISVDDSIHFLAKYRQELIATNFSVPKAVSLSIKETGASMVYTSIVLFGGFSIFTFSDFLGTKMLGLLTSTTLLCAMITNLLVLPALLITFDNGKRNPNSKALINSYEEEEEDKNQD